MKCELFIHQLASERDLRQHSSIDQEEFTGISDDIIGRKRTPDLKLQFLTHLLMIKLTSYNNDIILYIIL